MLLTVSSTAKKKGNRKSINWNKWWWLVSAAMFERDSGRERLKEI